MSRNSSAVTPSRNIESALSAWNAPSTASPSAFKLLVPPVNGMRTTGASVRRPSRSAAESGSLGGTYPGESLTEGAGLAGCAAAAAVALGTRKTNDKSPASRSARRLEAGGHAVQGIMSPP
jgi:hypothetical protein